MLTGELQFALGNIRVEVEDGGITACRFLRKKPENADKTKANVKGVSEDVRILKLALEQIEQYLNGKRKAFELPIRLKGTPFQKEVWSALLRLPFGELCSYGDLAHIIKHPRAARAVGNAVGANRHLLLVPCHRVIESNGGIGGFGCGLDIKKYLLAIEGKNFN